MSSVSSVKLDQRIERTADQIAHLQRGINENQAVLTQIQRGIIENETLYLHIAQATNELEERNCIIQQDIEQTKAEIKKFNASLNNKRAIDKVVCEIFGTILLALIATGIVFAVISMV